MKTPEEIKKGLEFCANSSFCDEECPYFEECNEGLESHATDALALIQQLEKRVIHLEALNQQDLSVITMQERRRARYDEQISQLEAQVPRWISVEDRLPENFATVIIFRDDCRNACIGWLIGGSWSVPKGVRVTHWMPLPEAPKEGM